MTFKQLLLSAFVAALPLAAQAQPVSGLYFGAGAGFNGLQSTKDTLWGPNSILNPLLGTANGEVKTTFEPGWGVVGSVGWGFGNGLRVEVEGNYRRNNVDEVRTFGRQNLASQGSIRSYGAMGNVFYDFALPSFVPQYLPVVPYIGAGAGYVWSEYHRVGAAFATNGRVTGAYAADDRDGRFAYQGIAGLAFPVAAVPGLSVTAEYRFLGTLSPKVDSVVVGRFGYATGRTEVDSYNHSAFLGLRYAFNAPRPAPAPVPPAAAPAATQEAARTYLVFFDWDRSDLTDRARQIIAEAAQNSRTAGVTRIEVS
ncbi:outer membrane protein, partial [Roseomonas elaeocarpi]